MAPLPSPAESFVLLERHGVPAHICRHSQKVALLSRGLAEALRRYAGEAPDEALAETAGLLHDIAKAACIETREDHAREGGRVLRGLGYAEVAALVERHVDLGPWDPVGPVSEAEILNYADKRVRHEEVVTLAERFDDLSERYGRDSEAARRRIAEHRGVMEAVERKIFRRLPFGPEALQTWPPPTPKPSVGG